MTKTKKTAQKEKTEVTPQALEIEKEAPVVMEDATMTPATVVDETPTAEANEETVMDETLVTTEIVTPVTEEPTPETPEDEMVEATAEELCPEEEAPEDKQEEEPMPESPEETPEEEEVVEEPIAEEVKETPKAPQPHKLGAVNSLTTGTASVTNSNNRMDYYTRNMLSQIRKVCDEQIKIELPKECIIKENMLLGKDASMLNEEAQTQDAQQPYVITSQNVQFGSVRASQEDAIRKTVGDVSLKPDALKYYPQIQDLVLNAEVSGLGVTFQFRYKDPSGDGCYIWAEGLQLSDANLRTVEKIRDAFLNWKESLVQDGDLLDKLNKEANKH